MLRKYSYSNLVLRDVEPQVKLSARLRRTSSRAGPIEVWSRASGVCVHSRSRRASC